MVSATRTGRVWMLAGEVAVEYCGLGVSKWKISVQRGRRLVVRKRNRGLVSGKDKVPSL